MKFRNQARLCLAIIYNMRLTLCLIFQGTRLPIWENFNSNVTANCGVKLFLAVPAPEHSKPNLKVGAKFFIDFSLEKACRA